MGYLLPKLWLRRKEKKRLKAFNQGLADTLQLMAGSLSAGLSLAQSVDTVVREGQEPIAGEFKRVLIETRLGVPLEDALDGIAERMGSKDFGWVVMAIRIQREVGGNLSELLTNVAATLRERDYLRRQVQTMSAEGKLSGLHPGWSATRHARSTCSSSVGTTSCRCSRRRWAGAFSPSVRYCWPWARSS